MPTVTTDLKARMSAQRVSKRGDAVRMLTQPCGANLNANHPDRPPTNRLARRGSDCHLYWNLGRQCDPVLDALFGHLAVHA